MTDRDALLALAAFKVSTTVFLPHHRDTSVRLFLPMPHFGTHGERGQDHHTPTAFTYRADV